MDCAYYIFQKLNARFLSVSLGFSGLGADHSVSMELFAESKDTLTAALASGGYGPCGPLILRGNAHSEPISMPVPSTKIPLTYLEGRRMTSWRPAAR